VAWPAARCQHGLMPEIQFAVNVHSAASRQDFGQLVRRADELGFDVFAAPDHLGFLAPFAALAAAGMISERLRLRTYVLNAGFWNPALLAREVATLDVLSGGRAELGLGAGHMKREHDDARLPWAPLGERIRQLEDTLAEVRRRLADPASVPQPVQQPVPVMIGAMSAAGLSVAASHADIVGFAGLRQIAHRPPGSFTLSSAAETRQRTDQVRAQAAGRPYRSDVLLQAVVIGQDPDKTAAHASSACAHRVGTSTAPSETCNDMHWNGEANARRELDLGASLRKLGRALSAHDWFICGSPPGWPGWL
jgi:probable F420-dependent oxidoreductase